MTASNDNRRFRAPKVMVTQPMCEAGCEVLKRALADDVDDVTDAALVAGIFHEMWIAYWTEVDAVRRKKQVGSVLQMPHSKLILPDG